MPGAGFLTGEAAGSEDPSACVRKTGVRTDAFAPRRVASSETARKATTEGAAGEAARRRANCLDESTAPTSADAEPRLGRRSEKLAMFSPTRVRIDTRLRMEESARKAGLLKKFRLLRDTKRTQIPFGGSDRGSTPGESDPSGAPSRKPTTAR